MLDSPTPARAAAPDPNTDLLLALEHAAAALARLDYALENHPLLPAFLYRARLDAVRRQASVDGLTIDPWHLAAILEGLRLRMDHELRVVDRGQVFEAARAALTLHQWLVEPDFDQEGQVQSAERHLAGAVGLVTAAEALRSWLQNGGARPPIRAALVRFWGRAGWLRAPVPLTAARALDADAPQEPGAWRTTFLAALATEADDALDLLRRLEHGWLAARARVPAQRRTSRATLAVDVMAAAPLLSATTLARALDMSIKGATELLDRFVAAEVAVEVTHRSARRLFGLAGMAPMREITAPPYRPLPGRGRGRPRLTTPETNTIEPPPEPSIARLERPTIDYAVLEAAMAEVETTLRRTRKALIAPRVAAGAPACDPPSKGRITP